MEFTGNVGENGYAAEPRSALIFLGTGCSSALPNARCLIQPSDPPCQVCFSSLSLPPDQNPNYSYSAIHLFSLIIVEETVNTVMYWSMLERHSGNKCFGGLLSIRYLRSIRLIVLTHEHADAVLGLDDLRTVQPHSPTNDIAPTPIYLTQEAMDSVDMKFPYLVQKKLKEGQEVRRVSQLEWKIIENDCKKPFVASGLELVPLPVSCTKSYFTMILDLIP
ncbi:hypothetical protein RHSIM_Rhsim09G0051000 [Rhododendron simsii]|uniref:Metallo-beta-lactamase domain-containing protein n=1 Tax=Rhododendron simsii TaxID=118357 RepID=A0A834GC95_RHOSS|nr:hypothetical protein RHSIM_Rhsim09G0051000 [Rhododendron simsii]